MLPVLATGHCGLWHGGYAHRGEPISRPLPTSTGPSHESVLIVPLVGAFFIDVINAFMIQGFIQFVR